ncbi:hypothetical protein L218DRAFT_954033 [Marasmius fiardii PR-910]|nr:hypothetical protein L218DRAFT_954033 [Marasmius fiardii PR-910]
MSSVHAKRTVSPTTNTNTKADYVCVYGDGRVLAAILLLDIYVLTGPYTLPLNQVVHCYLSLL